MELPSDAQGAATLQSSESSESSESSQSSDLVASDAAMFFGAAIDGSDAFAESSRPLPKYTWIGVALLLGAIAVLSIRLLLFGSSGHAETKAALQQAAGTAAPVVSSGPTKTADPSTILDVVERWRSAWQDQRLNDYVSFYAPTFGAQGKDLAAWAESKQLTFGRSSSIQVVLSDFVTQPYDHIMVVSFIQLYRSGPYQDRGRKQLYLMPIQGQWKIFNEEWLELPATDAPRDDRKKE